METMHFGDLPTELFDNEVDSMGKAQKTPTIGEKFTAPSGVILRQLLKVSIY
jgi:hypothetical protein